MTNDMIVYLICGVVCLVVIAVAIIIITIFNSKSKKKLEELENERQKLNNEKNKFFSEQTQLKKAQEDLKNAQILFQKEKEAKNDLSKKTEKEIAIDLFIKFIEIESTFDYMKNNLSSIDSKLVGVKNYSDDLFSMKREVETHLSSIKDEMKAMQEDYSSSLSVIHNDLKASLSNIENQIEGIVSSITEKQMNNLVQDVNDKLENLSSEFGMEIEKNMPNTIDEDDIEHAVENVFDRYTISSLSSDDVENVVRDAIDNAFLYSLNFENGIHGAVRDEISSELSDIVGKLNDIESAINS